MGDPLSEERIVAACETLTAAFVAVRREGFEGAIDAVDPGGTFVEARRNLTALVQWRHGNEAWERVLGG